MSLRRLSALVLMLAMTAAPLALTLCRVECAMAEAGEASAPAHHSCHADSAPAALTLTAVPHVCGHGDDATSGLEQALQSVAAPVAIVPVVVWTPPVIGGPVLATDVHPSPPRSFQLISQLRV
jgi:hypothetical protein